MKHTPLALIAELTHRCPLHCVYCSNPTELQARQMELATADWIRVFHEAAELGVLQLHLTGGEPTARDDLTQLIEAGRKAQMYSNLITSGLGLNEKKLEAWCKAGLDHLQLSFQDSEEAAANEFAGTRAHVLKLQAARLVKKFPLAFTINIVVHRGNLSRLEQMIQMAEELQADRLEIAHVQYYGWALKNRAALLPTVEQVNESVKIIQAARARLKDKIRIEFVVPDYHAKFPKPCMGGWGRTLLLIDPSGKVLPCHAAGVIPGMEFENVRTQSLRAIWEDSAAFQKFRGDDWMQEPCRGCERKTQDFGGCRCQAFMITGDAAATDPVCSLSPEREKIVEALDEAVTSQSAGSPAWTYRKLSVSGA
jgi:pyrroloquinoline quinone biosynthesis protein E